MNTERKTLSKEELKAKLDTLGEEITYRISEAKKAEGTEIAGAHKTDIAELMKDYRALKETHKRVLQTEQESLQLEDILASLSEEKEEDPDKLKEREGLQVSRVEIFSELIELVQQIKSALPKAKKQTEIFYRKNPKSFAVVFPTDQIKQDLANILEKLVGKEEEEK